MSIPATSIIFGIEPRLAIPMPDQAVQSIAMPRVTPSRRMRLDALAEQVVGGRVVGLAAVAEAPGDRAEDDGGPPGCRSPSAWSRWNQPSALTSNTRSYSACGLSGRTWLISSPAQCSRTSSGPPRRARRVDGGGDLRGVGEVAAVPVGRAAGGLDRTRWRRAPRAGARCPPARARRASASASRPRRAAAGRSSSSARRGRWRSPRCRGRAGSGAGMRSSRWNVPPPAAAARSAVIADTMLPAAPVTRKRRPGLQRARGVGVGRLLAQRDGPAQVVGVPDLDGARVAQRLLDEHVGERRGLAARRDVDDLHERVRRAPAPAPS